jgi:hypothetical protein
VDRSPRAASPTPTCGGSRFATNIRRLHARSFRPRESDPCRNAGASGAEPPSQLHGYGVYLHQVIEKRNGEPRGGYWTGRATLIAGICLLDALFIAGANESLLALLAALGFPLTLFFQRSIPGA